MTVELEGDWDDVEITEQDVLDENIRLANKCDNLQRDNQRLAEKLDEERALNTELIQENTTLHRYVEIMQRRLNNINHEMNAVREELGQ